MRTRQTLELLDKHTMWCSLGGSCVAQASLKHCGYWSPPSPWSSTHSDSLDFFSTTAIRELEEQFTGITPDSVKQVTYNGHPNAGQLLNYPEHYDVHYFGAEPLNSPEAYYHRFWDKKIAPFLEHLTDPSIAGINFVFNSTNEEYLREMPERNELNQLLLTHLTQFLDYLYQHYPRRYKLLFLIEEYMDGMILPTSTRTDVLALFCPKQMVFWYQDDKISDNNLNYTHYLASRYQFYEQLRLL